MSVVASALLGADGLAYLCMGACMLCPPRASLMRDAAVLYPSLFKPLRELSADAETPPVVRPVADLVHDLGYRMMAYLLVLVGAARLLTSVQWGCGFVYLGLWTCVFEVGLVCNELLRQESMFLHGAFVVLLGNFALSVCYVCLAAPVCH